MTRGDATREQKWEIRLACKTDIAALEELIPRSVRGLQSNCYSIAQMDAAIGSVFGVDRQLIRDGTYFVVEHEGEIVGCGGWSKRRKLFGSDALGATESELLDPETDAARIRAFFIHPKFSRRGIARAILLACEDAMRAENFSAAEMGATLPGEPFYAAFGYVACERYEVPIANNLTLPIVHMSKQL
jgi:GNAT superfamily N-acetyltransferase